ncbi:hypothetical protein MPC4_270010 [Methylocella tundrae]|uniref:Uncharacterized protein n=1 Tax=Methylocella tundrae TaxID=227605 RepID=A0A8B6M6H7_METTU|nr:hypothetical protein MPC4_270010 [Methylocella tundrae]
MFKSRQNLSKVIELKHFLIEKAEQFSGTLEQARKAAFTEHHLHQRT